MRKIAVVFAGALLIVVVGALIYRGTSAHDAQSALPSMQIGGETLHVLIADTTPLQERGLGGRDSLSPSEGMLFVFPKDGTYGFWMKDMRFSLDIIWLSDDGSVVYLVQNASPSSYPEVFAPQTPAKFVLEVPAGFAKAHDIKIGDRATLP